MRQRLTRVPAPVTAALAGLIATALSPLQVSAQLGGPAPDVFSDDSLRAFVCGSASPLGADPKRAQACIAITAGERLFLVDTGAGSAQTLALARLPLDNLKGVLLTHFHSDHIGDLGAINLGSWIASRTAPLTVMGPEGVATVVDGFNSAYSLDRSYRTTHHGEELLPTGAGSMAAKTIEAGVVYDQAGLKITAFAVDHAPIKPALGYRFDFGGRSIVVSGDTVRTESLQTAAQDADLLFHDTMAQGVMQQMQSMVASSNPRLAKLLEDVQTYHAPGSDVVALAKAAGVKQLVFYHLVPNPVNPLVANAYQQLLPDNGVLAADGMLFTLKAGSTTIERTQLLQQ